MVSTLDITGVRGFQIRGIKPQPQGLGFVLAFFRKEIEYGFGYIVIRSPYIPYSIYLRGTIGFRVEGSVQWATFFGSVPVRTLAKTLSTLRLLLSQSPDYALKPQNPTYGVL